MIRRYNYRSHISGKKIRGKKGRGAAGKTLVFGSLKRDGNVYVEIVDNCSKEEMLPIVEEKILEDSTIHTNGWKI